MKFIHTADLHIGQIIYQNYDRSDEHRHFFDQLKGWCEQERPDALLVWEMSGSSRISVVKMAAQHLF